MNVGFQSILVFTCFSFFQMIANMNKKLHQIKISSLFLTSVMCDVSWIRFFTHIIEPCFAHFGQFLKPLSDFKHSYLSQITTKN